MTSAKLFLLAGLLLSGCGANTSGDFLCPAQIGSPCATIGQADNTNRVGIIQIVPSDAQLAMGQLAQDPLAASGATGVYASMPDGGQVGPGGQYRTPEVVARAWIAPYLDAGGVLHESQYIYFVMAESHWVARP